MGFIDLIELDIDTPESLPTLGLYRFGLYCTQIVFAFLTFCIVIPVITIQGKYDGTSLAAPNYTLVVALFSMFLSVTLLLFPLVRYRNHLVPVRNFIVRPRTAFIFTCFFTFAWFAAMIAITAHTNSPENCTLDAELKKEDDSYAGTWMKQCNSAKAAAAFSWLSFFAWLATAVCNSILFWHDKKIRHAESSALAAKAMAEKALRSVENDNTNNILYDEDARTIVDMDYTTQQKDKKKQYPEDNNMDDDEEAQDTNTTYSSSPNTLPSAPPSVPPLNPGSGFSSPFVPQALTIDTTRSSSVYNIPTPTNLVASFVPHPSPYSVPASVPANHNPQYYPQSPSPYQAQVYHHQQQPYSPAPYSNIPLDQSFNHSSPSLYRDPSLVYQQPHPQRNTYHAGQPYPSNTYN